MRRHVTIVDGDVDIQHALSLLGHSTSVFATAAEFLREQDELETDCVILNAAMPEMSDPVTRRELLLRKADRPIFLITQDAGDGRHLLDLRPADCLVKPIEPDDLRRALDKMLERAVGTTMEGSMYRTMEVSRDLGTLSSGLQGKPRVYIVDDDISVRESLELLIKSSGWEPILFENAQHFLAYRRSKDPSCLVLDVNMPGLNGLDLQRTIVAGGNALPIIFITGFGDVPMTVRAMKAGAAEFLTKPVDNGALLDAVRSALQFSEQSSRAESELAELTTAYKSLSPREREVMTLVVKGLLNKQVAFELSISEITVKAHRGQVMRKMNARSLPDLVNMAARLRLTSE